MLLAVRSSSARNGTGAAASIISAAADIFHFERQESLQGMCAAGFFQFSLLMYLR